jgi:hypothetical protein
MTAPIGTPANIYTGTREFGQVTNTYGGYLQSAGSAYNLQTPWQADMLEWWRYTTYGTNDKNLQGVWFRDFPAGDDLIISRGTTDLSSILETTNGVTIANTAGGFANEHKVISGITTATPGVVTTSTNHGYSDGDRVVITKVIGTAAAELNNNTYVVDVLSATTFALYDVYGVPVTVVGAYSSSGQSTLTGPSLGIVDAPVLYYLTLGSAIMGTDNDIIYFRATKFNYYVNLGDVA